MATINRRKVKAVTEKALEAFWATVAEYYQNAEAGDLQPDVSEHFAQVAENTVLVWVNNNVPYDECGVKE